VVVIGFSYGGQAARKRIFDYPDINGDPIVREVSTINPYLAEAPSIFVDKVDEPLCPVPAATFGSMPNDGGYLLLTEEEADTLRAEDPIATKYLRPLASAREMLHDEERWCLWLVGADPSDVRNSVELTRRIRAVRLHRESSARPATRQLAATPGLFGERRQPSSRYLCMPRHPSANRAIAPMLFFDESVIASDSTIAVAGADLYLFGVLQSAMFTAWIRAVGGHIKSDLRLSCELVYNTFPFAEPSPAQHDRVAAVAQVVLDARARHPDASLADLYDPDSAPAELVRAHRDLDRAVERTFGRRIVRSDVDRLSILFDRYQQLVASGELPGLTEGADRRRPRRRGHRQAP
jgi:hypothetical protein